MLGIVNYVNKINIFLTVFNIHWEVLYLGLLVTYLTFR